MENESVVYETQIILIIEFYRDDLTARNVLEKYCNHI